MTDLEMVRLCAEAMGLMIREVSLNAPEHTLRIEGVFGSSSYGDYWPLTNRAQCFELVERFHVHIGDVAGGPLDGKWWACLPRTEIDTVYDPDLSRAIVTTVARMELARKEGK